MQTTDYNELREQKLEQLPVLFTSSEAMEVLGVGRNTMYRLLNSGELPAIRIGRSWRITWDALEDYLLANVR